MGTDTTASTSRGGLLDVEDEEQRGLRIQGTLSKLNASSASASKSPSSGSWISTSPPDFTFLNRDARSRPCAVPPPSELLSRVQAFLPALHASNTLLAKRAHEDPASVDIECLDQDESMGGYVEMNLGLGLFDMHSPPQPLQRTFGLQDSTTSCSSSYSSSSSGSSRSSYSASNSYSYSHDEDSDSDEDLEIITSWRPIRPVRPLPRRASTRHAHSHGVGMGEGGVGMGMNMAPGAVDRDKEMGGPGLG